MAASGRITFSSYPNNNSQQKQNTGTMGVTQNLPSALTRWYAAEPGTTAGNNVTINSIVQLLPNGLRVDPVYFYTDSTPAQLGSNGS